MKVKELIEELQKVNPEGNVHTGYDGNIVCEEAGLLEEITSDPTRLVKKFA